MIRTRVLVGTILALAAAGVLVADSHLKPWFPCLFACLMVAGVLTGRELVRLFPAPHRPGEPPVVASILLCLSANWFPIIGTAVGSPASQNPLFPFVCILFVFLASFVALFLLEMYRFQEPGSAMPRLGAGLLAITYLGVLPCCFVQIRFLPTHAILLLAMTIFVPKGNDIAAFFTGTFLGRNKMTPLLSPKKTWEGFLGGMLGSILVSVGLSLCVVPDGLFPGGVVEAALFGMVVGLAGVLGDLAESLLKRDCLTKDASKNIPGFGGLLDVVDSVLFAAPVAYLWFLWRGI